MNVLNHSIEVHPALFNERVAELLQYTRDDPVRSSNRHELARQAIPGMLVDYVSVVCVWVVLLKVDSSFLVFSMRTPLL